MRSTRRRLLSAAVFVSLAAALAACGSPAAEVVTTTTTTTTLPLPVRVSAGSGSDGTSPLGSVYRVSVLSVPDRATVPAATPVTFESPLRTKIGYRQLGSGPELLLVMGTHGTMTGWDPQLLNALAGHFHVTVFDLPGVGFSGAPPGGSSLDADADVTAGLIDGLSLVKPIVLGWGLGGTVALDLVERHPGLVSRLVLADATAGGATATPPEPAVFARLASPIATTESLSWLYFPANQQAGRLGWLARLAQVSPDDEVASSIAGQAKIWRAVFSEGEVAKGLSAIHIPVLVIAGGRDIVVPVANARAIARRLPHADLVVYRRDGYAALVEEPSALNRVVTFGQAG